MITIGHIEKPWTSERVALHLVQEHGWPVHAAVAAVMPGLEAGIQVHTLTTLVEHDLHRVELFKIGKFFGWQCLDCDAEDGDFPDLPLARSSAITHGTVVADDHDGG